MLMNVKLTHKSAVGMSSYYTKVERPPTSGTINLGRSFEPSLLHIVYVLAETRHLKSCNNPLNPKKYG